MADSNPIGDECSPKHGLLSRKGDEGEAESDDAPPNFSWIFDGLLCACAFPATLANLRCLNNRGVKIIVSLTAERDLPEHDIPDLKIVRLKVEDFTPLTIEQVQQFIHTVEEAEKQKTAVAVHCAAGKGRTGTVIACYLVKRMRWKASQAIEYVRMLRPGSVETNAQEKLVSDFEALLLA